MVLKDASVRRARLGEHIEIEFESDAPVVTVTPDGHVNQPGVTVLPKAPTPPAQGASGYSDLFQGKFPDFVRAKTEPRE